MTSSCTTRDLHGDRDNGITAGMRTTVKNYRGNDGDGERCHGNTTVMGLSQTVILR